jgi:Na+/H+-dicarboxylate symporter
MNELEGIIVPIVFFALVFGIVYIALSARNKERMALIEKGADASIFYSGKKARGSGKWVLTLGIVIVGIALGVLVGYFLENGGMKDDVAYPASIFLFGGAGMIAAYFIGKKINGNKE